MSANNEWGTWERNRPEPGQTVGSVSINQSIPDADDNRLVVTFYKGETDGKPVIQVDGEGDFRINVNDGAVYDRHTDSNSLIGDAALMFYQWEVVKHLDGSDKCLWDRDKIQRLRAELLEAYAIAKVDAAGKLFDWDDALDGMNPTELRDLARIAAVKAANLESISIREDARESGS